jgi:hypothetical protein
VTDYLPYAGIGSRPKPGKPVPPAATELARAIASSLERSGHTLRSGAAAGMDEAFESGVASGLSKEIYLPWEKFNGHPSKLYLRDYFPHSVIWRRLYSLAKQHHPAWKHVSAKAALLLMRNGQQILGDSLDQPSRFVLCWTHDGKDSGGTGQAIRIARAHEIPVYNLNHAPDRVSLYMNFDWSGECVDKFRLAANK